MLQQHLECRAHDQETGGTESAPVPRAVRPFDPGISARSAHETSMSHGAITLFI